MMCIDNKLEQRNCKVLNMVVEDFDQWMRKTRKRGCKMVGTSIKFEHL